VAAKGVEDTALYRDARLLARNEPGLDPGWLHSTAADLHDWCRSQASRHPMTTTSTHDTKRGEDVRSRIAALTLMAGEWVELCERWMLASRAHGGTSTQAPGPSEQWLLYQTLVGSWPAGGPDAEYADRITAYLVKALREAKEETSWLAPDADYEAMVTGFAQRLLTERDGPFVRDIDAFAGRVAKLGAAISLGQLAAKLIAPGAPDIYWGNEVTQLTLVDPDNRRPVDFEANGRLLAELRRRHADDPQALVSELGRTMADGRLKLLVTHLGLQLRRRFPEVFRDGAYVPVDAGRDMYAGARRLGERWVVAVAHLRPGAAIGRTPLALPGAPPARLRDVLSQVDVDPASADIRTLLRAAPIALLEPVS
jgi:(1->4)-alpha-D-glucan 1-alpha-D-glucosylmutase